MQRLLRERKARFTPFWAVNAVAAGGDRALLEALAARPEVAAIVPDRKLEVPAPSPAQRQGTVADIEWGVDRIGAPAVWSELGANGQGIVVAGLDTGVQFDHPALVRQYRGRQPDGTFSHGYNWFDSAPVLDGIVNACPERGVPCDEDGHGTHTMGTIAGDGGEGHHVGVAPGPAGSPPAAART